MAIPIPDFFITRKFFISTLIFFITTALLYSQDDSTMVLPFWGVVQSPGSKDMFSLTVDSTGTIYAGTAGSGVGISTNGGQSWNFYTSGLTNLFVTDVEFDSSRTLYASTWGGGIFRSTDRGQNWSAINSGLANLYVRNIKIKRSNNIIFAGTYGSGVFRSTDNGQNWSQVTDGIWYRDITSLIIASTGAIVAGSSGAGIFRSTDDGITWLRSSAGLVHKTVTSFVMNHLGEIYCGTYGGGVHISVDNGISWKQYYPDTSDKRVTCVALYTADQPVCGTNEKGVYKYDILYERWRQSYMSTMGVNAITRNSQGVLYAYFPKEGFYRSTNAGIDWSRQSLNDEIGISRLRSYYDSVVFCTSKPGGIWRSTDDGANWALAAMSGTQVNNYCFDSTGAAYAVTGLQGIHRSTDKGVSWNSIGQSGSTFYSIEAGAPGIMFAGSKYLYHTTDYGSTWTMISDPLVLDTNTGIRAIGCSKNGSVFVISQNGLLRSTNDGASWSVVLPKSVWAYNIAFNAYSHIFVASDSGLYRSTNNGNTWTRFSFGWDYPMITQVVITPRNDIYVGTRWEQGILHSSDNGANWDTVNLGYNLSIIKSMIMTQNKHLLVSTTSLYRTVESYDLTPPLLNSPNNMVTGVSLKPKLIWSASDRAELYDIQIAGDLDFANIVEEAVVSSTEWQLRTKLDNNYAYHWRVRGKTNSSLGDWSAVRHFFTIVGIPVLISPPKDTGNLPNAALLKWHSVDGAGTYILQVSKDSVFSTTVVNKELKDTTYNMPSLDVYTKYYWRVAAKGAGSQGDWSEVWTFKTKITSVRLRSPANGTYGIPEKYPLEWSPLQAATGYEIQISKDKYFSKDKILYQGETQSDSMHTILNMEYFTTYYWKIRPYDKDGFGDWSETWSYTTVIQPAVLFLPEDSIYNQPLSLDLKWDAYEKATKYHVQAATDTAFKNIIFSDTNATGISTGINNLDNYTTYYWRTRIIVNGLAGLWSKTWRFTTKLGSPQQSAPRNDSLNNYEYVHLIWKALKGAEYYKVQAGEAIDFISPEVSVDSVKELQVITPKLKSKTQYFWRVMGYNIHGIGDWSEVWQFTTRDYTSSVSDIASPAGFYLTASPNPFNSSLSIKYFAPGGGEAQISFMSIMGIQAASFNIRSRDGMNTVLWQPEDLAPGIYMIKLTVGGCSTVYPVTFVR